MEKVESLKDRMGNCDIPGVAAKMTRVGGCIVLKVDNESNPNIFPVLKNLMAIFHAKGFCLTMLSSYESIDNP